MILKPALSSGLSRAPKSSNVVIGQILLVAGIAAPCPPPCPLLWRWTIPWWAQSHKDGISPLRARFMALWFSALDLSLNGRKAQLKLRTPQPMQTEVGGRAPLPFWIILEETPCPIHSSLWNPSCLQHRLTRLTFPLSLAHSSHFFTPTSWTYFPGKPPAIKS